MVISKEKKQWYIDKVHEEMHLRGFTDEEIERAIGKTGFYQVMEECTEAQFHYSIEDTVDEILEVAAKS